MRHCAHLWNSIDSSLKRAMLRISFQDVERGLQEAKAAAGTYATELVDSERRQDDDMLVRYATTIATSVHHTEATIPRSNRISESADLGSVSSDSQRSL